MIKLLGVALINVPVFVFVWVMASGEALRPSAWFTLGMALVVCVGGCLLEIGARNGN